MRGVRRLGALFLCVAALRGETLPKREYLLNRGYKVSVDRGGNPFYVKMVRKGELQAVQVDVTEELEDIELARDWLAVVTPLLGKGDFKSPQVGIGKFPPLHVAAMHGLGNR